MRRLILLVCTLVAAGFSAAQETAPRLAMPVDPVEAIIQEFETHDFVAIVVGGYDEEHEVLHTLLNTPAFSSIVDVIVVEFGGSRHQDTIDTFTSGGSVPYAELEKVWQQTTQPHHVSDPPVYGAFFRAVREVNSELPEDDQLRVLGAEPPIDWDQIEDYQDLLPWLQRRFPFEAEVVEREVLDKGRKALLLSGGLHFANGTPLLNAIDDHGASILKIWTISDQDLTALQPDIESWPRPSLARVQDTTLGAADIVESYMAINFPPGPFEEQFDAVLYLGPESSLTESEIAPELCSDQEYLAMRLPRLQIAADGGAPFLDQFTEYCNSVLDSR